MNDRNSAAAMLEEVAAIANRDYPVWANDGVDTEMSARFDVQRIPVAAFVTSVSGAYRGDDGRKLPGPERTRRADEEI